LLECCSQQENVRQHALKTQSAAVCGIDANIIAVEVDVSPTRSQEENFQTVGLPDAAVRESQQRIRAALRNCSYEVPITQININLTPPG
jgi:magnesium chelatase family protein